MKLPSSSEMEAGVIYDIKYPIVGREKNVDQEYFRVSTTRPETLFGDTGIAINSADSYHMVEETEWGHV